MLILGKPIVTTDCSGMRDLFGDIECGIITPNDENGLYKGIKELLINNDKINDLTNNAITRGKYFEKNTRVKEMEDILDNL